MVVKNKVLFNNLKITKMLKVNSTFAIAAIAIMMVIVSCRTTTTVVNDPCEGEKYFTTSELFRAKGIGKSVDKASARNKGLLEARAELSREVKTHTFEVTNRFEKEYTSGWSEDLQRVFESWVEQSAEMILRDNSTICEKMLQYNEARNNYFEFHVVVQTSKDKYLQYLEDGYKGDDNISQDDKDRINFEFENYKKLYKERKDEYDNRLKEQLDKSK